MQRVITAFHQDDLDDWVADLSCLHTQHVRDRPPLWPRPWVLTQAGRREHIGSALDCPLCDRAELPADLTVVRTAGPFDDATLPPGLRRDHRVAEHTWGRLRVLVGSVHFVVQTDPLLERDLGPGDEQPIPPGVLHAVTLSSATIEVDFLTRPTSERAQRDL